MKLTKALELMETYASCPKCGSSDISGGEGRLTIRYGTFYRSCKCGWEVKIEDVKEAEA